MQSNTAIALFTKMKMLFEKDNKFLAFPSGPVSLPYSNFSFLDMDISTGAGMAQSLRLAANFAKSFNFISETSTKLSYDDRNLWDVYQSVLDKKVLASGNRSATDEQRIQQLRDYLLLPSIKREDGSMISRQDNYDIFQSKYYEVQTEYNIKKFTAESSSEKADKDLWSLEEPALKVKCHKALNDWVLKGFKNEVKNANDEMSYLSTKGPYTAWDEYRDDFNKAKFTQTELGGAVDFDFYSTSFYPNDFYLPQSTSWNKFTLSKNELAVLCARAPEELKGLTSDIKLNSLSAEIAYVDIRRPWMHSEIFSEKNWKLPATELPLSDGGNPARGRIPAFPVAIIFARKVKVELDSSTGTPQKVEGIKTVINSNIFTNLSTIKLINPNLVGMQPGLTTVMPQREVLSTAPRPLAIKTSDLGTVSATPITMIRKEQPVAGQITSLQRLQPVKLTVVNTSPIISNKFIVNEKYKILTKSTVNKDAKPATPAPATPPTEGDLEILAFVCQRMPLCPNPDPALTWA